MGAWQELVQKGAGTCCYRFLPGTPFVRQAWINELRAVLADIFGKLSHYWAAGYEDRNEKEYQNITEKICKLELYLNPNENDHKLLLEKVKNMESLLSKKYSKKNDLLFWSSRQKSLSLSQAILKREWERVKNEV